MLHGITFGCCSCPPNSPLPHTRNYPGHDISRLCGAVIICESFELCLDPQTFWPLLMVDRFHILAHEGATVWGDPQDIRDDPELRAIHTQLAR